MKISWIPWGIDLGTTNSVISCYAGTSPEVLANQYGSETTPSAVAMTPRSGSARPDVQVGQRAIQRRGRGSLHVKFKRDIGETERLYKFHGVDQEFTAIDLSAAVLAELSKLRRTKDHIGEIDAAVVTIPADFTPRQQEATLEAAKKAGFAEVKLLLEPLAAALAFGAEQHSEHEPLWIVYDLGGGTFDAALVKCSDGEFNFEDHLGDLQKGGTDLDEAIAKEILLPQFDQHERSRLAADAEALALLEAKAEEAKCAVSFDESYQVYWDYAGSSMELTVAAQQVQNLETRLFAATVDLCRQLLVKNNLKPDDIEKIVMVGGQTRSRHLRKMLRSGASDPVSGRTVAGLGIELDTSADPMTVVSRGAAIYAASQQLQNIVDDDGENVRRAFEIRLGNVPAQTSGERQRIVGKCIDAPVGITLIVQRHDGTAVGWESQVEIDADGKFLADVPLEPGPNSIQLIALDEEQREVSRASCGILRSNVDPGAQKLPWGVGVVTVDGGVSWFFPKNTPVDDLDEERSFLTTEAIEADSRESAIVIPLVIGENPAGYLNRAMSHIRVSGADLKKSIPKNTEIMVSLEIPELGVWKCNVVSEANDIDVSVTVEHGYVAAEAFWRSYDQARADFTRLEDVAAGNPDVAEVLEEIRSRRLFEEVDELVPDRSVKIDESKITAASQRLIEIRRLMHPYRVGVNLMLLWDAHLKYCNKNMTKAQEIIDEIGIRDPRWLQKYEELKDRYRTAVEERDFDSLERIAFEELPALFEEHRHLKERTKGGMAQRGEVDTLDLTENLGSTIKEV